MALLIPHLPTFAVAGVFLIWSAYRRWQRRQRALRERVAYMLWVTATLSNSNSGELRSLKAGCL